MKRDPECRAEVVDAALRGAGLQKVPYGIMNARREMRGGGVQEVEGVVVGRRVGGAGLWVAAAVSWW